MQAVLLVLRGSAPRAVAEPLNCTPQAVNNEYLAIILLFLPRQAPELNAVDQRWKYVKAQVSANRQYNSVEEQAGTAEAFVKSLSPKQTLRLASVLSKNFWLRKTLETNFCKIT